MRTLIGLALALTPALAAAGGGNTAFTSDGTRLETATFSMYCYWTGEAAVGRVSGVVRTRIGEYHGREIVQVDFDPSATSAGALERALREQGGFSSRIDPNPAGARFLDPKHTLRTSHPELYYLDLDERQAIALNTWSYFGGAMPDVLTPEQTKMLPAMTAKLRAGAPGQPDPAGSREGAARDEYRRKLIEWLGR